MNKTKMLQALEAAVPSLQEKLHIERVLYKKAANKAYMSFLCDELVRENDFLQVERTLKELFPQVNVALRIASPGLGEDFPAPSEPGAAGVAGRCGLEHGKRTDPADMPGQYFHAVLFVPSAG